MSIINHKLLIISLLVLSAILLISCESKEYGPNVIRINNAEYAVELVTSQHYGAFATNCYNTDLRLYTEGISISDNKLYGNGIYLYIELFSSAANGFVTGTYYHNGTDNYKPYTFGKAWLVTQANLEKNTGVKHPVVSGTVEIEVLKNNEYDISYQLITDDNRNVNGHYKGAPVVIIGSANK